MEKVKVNRETLLETLKGNRDKHKQEYDEALAGWKTQAIDKLEENLEKFRNEDFSEVNPLAYLPKPQMHLRDYDLAIRMLEMSVDENIEIEQDDFNRYVMDEWAWKAGFATTYSNYTNLG